MQIRAARPEDAQGIANLLREIEWFSHLREQTPEETRDLLARELALCQSDHSHLVLIAEEEDRVVGYVSLHILPYLFLSGPEAYVSELFISEPARGRSIGAQLLEVVQTQAREHGCIRLRLLNNRTRESYRRRFYEKHGWTERNDLATMEYTL